MTQSTNLVLPNFMIIGGSKCGSTSLYHYLSSHPEIFMSQNKEPRYFQYNPDYERGLAWYSNEYYSGGAEYSYRGEASAAYLYKERVARRIKNDLPASSHRFVVLVRDPVDRAYSQFWHQVRRGDEHRDFLEAALWELRQLEDDQALLDEDALPYIGRSLFAYHIERYVDYFGEDCILVLSLEDVADRWTEALEQLYEFLGVETRIVLEKQERHNVGGSPRLQSLHYAANAAGRISGPITRLLPDTVARIIGRAVRRLTWQRGRYPPLGDRARQVVREAVREDVGRLRRFTGRDFSNWTV